MGQEVDAALRFDALDTAEKLLGTTDREAAMPLTMALHIQHIEEKRALLEMLNDTHSQISHKQFMEIVSSLGFVKMHEHVFKIEDDNYIDGKQVTTTRDELMQVWWRSGVLLDCTTWYEQINTVNVYYNWSIPDGVEVYPGPESGGCIIDKETRGWPTTGRVWVGHHDGREGLRRKLQVLEQRGSFLPVWKERPFLWLLDYSQTRTDYDYKQINAEVIATLPVEVQLAIRGEEQK
jgi:hypothetical protein